MRNPQSKSTFSYIRGRILVSSFNYIAWGY